MNKYLVLSLIIFLFLFNLNFIYADSFSDCSVYGNCKKPITEIPTINYSLIPTVNDSDYLDGQHGSYYIGYCDTALGDYYTKTEIDGFSSSWLSTYNATYHGSINNASYLTTYNSTYDSKVSMNYSNLALTNQSNNITGGIKAINFTTSGNEVIINTSGITTTKNIQGTTINATSGRFDGGVSVGTTPDSTIGYRVSKSVGTYEGGTGLELVLTPSGTEAQGIAFTNILTCSGTTSVCIGADNNIVSSGVANDQDLTGMNFYMGPNGAGVATKGAYIFSTANTYNNPTVEQIGMKLEWKIGGADNSNNRWAIKNVGTVVNASKVLLGMDNVKTYWGTGYEWTIYNDGSNLFINRESGSGILNLTSNVTINQMLKIQRKSGSLPACASATNGTIDSNATKLYFCDGTVWQGLY